MPEPIDPELAKVIEDLLATAPPGYVEWRRHELEDDDMQWYRDRYPELVAQRYDPEEIKWGINAWLEAEDPYSEYSLNVAAFCDSLASGGDVTMTNMKTGEVIEWHQSGMDEEAARTN